MKFLETIVQHKYEEVSRRKASVKHSDLRSMKYFGRTPLSLADALRTGPFSIIAEIKRTSPSEGLLASNVNPATISREYEVHGAAAISVLTDEQFFSGSLQDLHTVRETVRLPLLRKEFIIDEYQVFEAKAYGADAVLLIAAILEAQRLRDLFLAASELHLGCLVELYEESEIDKLDFDTMKLIGVNNRDLRTFAIDLGRTCAIAQRLPTDVTVVSESGIRTPQDIRNLADCGVHAALVGEQLMKSASPGKALRQLLSGVDR